MTTIVVWLFIVFALSLLPVEKGPLIPHGDKLFHFIIYAITSALFFVTLIKKTTFRRAAVAAVMLSSGYGLLMEFAQVFTQTRRFSLADEAANILGAASAIAFIWYRRRRHGA